MTATTGHEMTIYVAPQSSTDDECDDLTDEIVAALDLDTVLDLYVERMARGNNSH